MSNTYGFNLQIPMPFPTDEQVEVLSENLETYLQKLVDDEYLTKEEVVAFLQFTTYLSGITPFLLDPFLSSYRDAKKQSAQEDSGLIIPA